MGSHFSPRGTTGRPIGHTTFHGAPHEHAVQLVTPWDFPWVMDQPKQSNTSRGEFHGISHST